MLFKEPILDANGTTASFWRGPRCFGKALIVVVKSSSTQKGDWKPLIFLMTDGQPTDSWEQAADNLKKSRPANLIACAIGTDADEQLLKRITEIVVKMENVQPDSFKAFFKWVSSSIKATSQSVNTQGKRGGGRPAAASSYPDCAVV